MYTQFITRNGNLAIIDGISEYYIFNQEVIILTGKIDGIEYSWDGSGRLKTNKVLGIREANPYDITDWVKEEKGTGLYYFEKGKK